jgi:hypothetical protein
LIDSAGHRKERGGHPSVKQGREPNLDVADIAIIETEPDVPTPSDRIQYLVEGAHRNPVSVLVRLKLAPWTANSVEADIQYRANRHQAS